MSTLESWRLLPLMTAAGTAAEARRAEAEGWTGVGLPDTQNKLPGPYVEMTVAGLATTTLKLATSVTNPFTRNAAVTATAIASVQAHTSGRAVLGVGRGDSSLACLGYAPAPVAVLADYLDRVQSYLQGDAQPFGPAAEGLRMVDSEDLSGRPTDSRIQWIDRRSAKVPTAVAASGPKVIAVAAVRADEVTFAVAASVERLRWRIDIARTARRECGLDPDGMRFGAYLPFIVHEDRATARELIAGDVASFARFSVMRGQVSGPATDGARRVLQNVDAVYDLSQHYTAGSAASQVIDDQLVDTFAIAGPAAYCGERVHELAALGVSKSFVLRVGRGIDPDLHRQADRDLVDGVLTHFVR